MKYNFQPVSLSIPETLRRERLAYLALQVKCRIRSAASRERPEVALALENGLALLSNLVANSLIYRNGSSSLHVSNCVSYEITLLLAFRANDLLNVLYLRLVTRCSKLLLVLVPSLLPQCSYLVVEGILAMIGTKPLERASQSHRLSTEKAKTRDSALDA